MHVDGVRGTSLVPVCSLVEDGVARDVDALGVWVVEAVGLGPILVADEDHLAPAIVEFSEGHASEHTEGFFPYHA